MRPLGTRGQKSRNYLLQWKHLDRRRPCDGASGNEDMNVVGKTGTEEKPEAKETVQDGVLATVTSPVAGSGKGT